MAAAWGWECARCCDALPVALMNPPPHHSPRSLAHPKFKPGSFDYDIAALILEAPANAPAARCV